MQSMMEGGDAMMMQTREKNKRLTMPKCQWFIACCLLGLESLHETHQLLHRDLKEENLLIDANG